MHPVFFKLRTFFAVAGMFCASGDKKPVPCAPVILPCSYFDYTASAQDKIEFTLVESMFAVRPIFRFGNTEMPTEIMNGVEV